MATTTTIIIIIKTAAAATARNQNINNLLICKYRMIMPTQTRGNFKLFIVFLLTKFGFIGSWVRASTGIVAVYVCHPYVRIYIRLLGHCYSCFVFVCWKKINIYLTCFERETTKIERQRASDWLSEWVRECVCVCVCLSIENCVFNHTAFDDIHLDA